MMRAVASFYQAFPALAVITNFPLIDRLTTSSKPDTCLCYSVFFRISQNPLTKVCFWCYTIHEIVPFVVCGFCVDYHYITLGVYFLFYLSPIYCIITFCQLNRKSGSASFKMHSRKNLSFPTVFAFLFGLLLLCLLLLFLPQTFTDGACFRFLVKQICHITLAVVHHHRIVLLAVSGF